MEPTTDASLRSFVPVDSGAHFPIQNLPFGVFRPRAGGRPRVGVAIGEWVLDLALLESRGAFKATSGLGVERVFDGPALNAFLALGRPAWRAAPPGQGPGTYPSIARRRPVPPHRPADRNRARPIADPAAGREAREPARSSPS